MHCNALILKPSSLDPFHTRHRYYISRDTNTDLLAECGKVFFCNHQSKKCHLCFYEYFSTYIESLFKSPYVNVVETELFFTSMISQFVGGSRVSFSACRSLNQECLHHSSAAVDVCVSMVSHLNWLGGYTANEQFELLDWNSIHMITK